jgi:hypothetical protein
VTIDPIALRVFVYDAIIRDGRIPTSQTIARQFATSQSHAIAAVRDLQIGKTVLPDASGEIWMAGPFSRDETSYRVIGASAVWWANCAWDMLGIPALVGENVRVETACTDCGHPMTIEVDATGGPEGNAVVHFLVPAAEWYTDIGFT